MLDLHVRVGFLFDRVRGRMAVPGLTFQGIWSDVLFFTMALKINHVYKRVAFTFQGYC